MLGRAPLALTQLGTFSRLGTYTDLIYAVARPSLADSLYTNPAVVKIATTETRTLAVEMSAYLTGSQHINSSSVVTQLIAMGAGGEYSYPIGLTSSAILDGTIILQPIGRLTSTQYRFVVSFSIVGGSEVLSTETLIRVPF